MTQEEVEENLFFSYFNWQKPSHLDPVYTSPGLPELPPRELIEAVLKPDVEKVQMHT